MRRVVTLLVCAVVGATAHADPARIAWIGVERGPLPPAEAQELEKLIIDELDGYESFRLVDAAGHALDARLLASDVALVARLKDEGIDLALEFKTPPALKKFDQAIALFESRLMQLFDYELLHDTMLAKAEAQFQSGNNSAAKTTLKQLAPLSPKHPPTAKTHPAALVKIWNEAQDELGQEGTIEVTSEGCTIQIDGQNLGPAPLLATRIPPGKHYLVARWTHGFSYQPVEVTPGREAKVEVLREGPAEEARVSLLSAIDLRTGLDEAKQAAARSAKLAESEGTLLVAIKGDADGKRWLLLAHHDANGELVAIVKAPLERTIEDERTATTLKRAATLVFVERKRGEHVLAPDGTASTGDGLTKLLYQGVGQTETPPPPPPPPNEIATNAPPPPPIVEEQSIIEAWWFWTILGGVIAGAGIGVGIWAGTRAPTTTEFEVILP